MGSWQLQTATPDIRDRNDVYGHYFAVRFKLKYTPSQIGSFSEIVSTDCPDVKASIEVLLA